MLTNLCSKHIKAFKIFDIEIYMYDVQKVEDCSSFGM